MGTVTLNPVTTLGAGYDSIEIDSRQKAIAGEEKRENLDFYHSNLRSIKSKEDYIRTVNASLGGGISVGSVGATLDSSLENSHKFNYNDIFYALEIDIVEYVRILTTFDGNGVLKAKLQQNPTIQNLIKFNAEYGDCFVDQINYGKKITAIIQFKNVSVEDRTKFDENLNVKILQGEIHQKLSIELSKLNQKANVQIDLTSIGFGIPTTTNPDSIETLIAYINNLLAHINKNGQGNTSVQISCETKPYKSIEATDSAILLSSKHAQTTQLLKEISQRRDFINRCLDQLKFAKSSPYPHKENSAYHNQLEKTERRLVNKYNSMKRMFTAISEKKILTDAEVKTYRTKLKKIDASLEIIKTNLPNFAARTLIAEIDSYEASFPNKARSSHKIGKLILPEGTERLHFKAVLPDGTEISTARYDFKGQGHIRHTLFSDIGGRSSGIADGVFEVTPNILEKLTKWTHFYIANPKSTNGQTLPSTFKIQIYAETSLPNIDRSIPRVASGATESPAHLATTFTAI